MAGLRDEPQNRVRVIDGRRHEVGRLVAGVAEHDALVARAFFLVGAGLARVDALRDIGGLPVQQHLDVACVPVEARLLVADVLDRHARGMRDPVLRHGRGAARLARDHHLVGGGERFAGRADIPGVDPGPGALAVEQVDDFVGDAIADLVGMSLRDGLAREQIVAASQVSLQVRRNAPLACLQVASEVAGFCQPPPDASR